MTSLAERRRFKTEDLVLRVSYDTATWDESPYEAFIDELCGYREYQKSAIRAAMRFLAGGRYANLQELAKENFEDSDTLQQYYGSWAHLERELQLPNQLSCSLDLATATGKSFVLYGIASIALASRLVDRVLVLCPSNTIEAGLISKFRLLAENASLNELLNSPLGPPRVINASESMVSGSVCVENYHAILKNVKSSIRDGVRDGGGARTLVLNDEAHHVANESGSGAKRWKEFLADSDYRFRYVVGASGTCYVGDQYFTDVIFRYSLREAMEQRFVKRVEYVAEMPETRDPYEKWQIAWNRHAEWKRRLAVRDIRPLTIVVTKDIKSCEVVADDLCRWLAEWEQLSMEDAQKKVLAVSSAPAHQPNLALLPTVDDPSSRVEWIVSVSMLSEGWDVKNVFQIVPHEERAFNSKLLIAQVLGRGLRRPENWQGEDPLVTVLNHDAWSGRIKALVDEILDIERRITSVVDRSSQYNFSLHTVNYDRDATTSKFEKRGEYKVFDVVELPTQAEEEAAVVEFERALTNKRALFETKIRHKMYAAADVAEQLYQRMRSIDDETSAASDPKDRTSYSKQYGRDECLKIVTKSLERAGIKSGLVTDENRQRFLRALGTLRRRSAKFVVYRLRPTALIKLNTCDRQSESCSAAELRRTSKTIFYSDDANGLLPDEQLEFFDEITDPDSDLAGAVVLVPNASDFKTPARIVIADATPERRFVRELCNRRNSAKIHAWLKNSHVGFYEIEYAWRKGEHTKRGLFSPDFFLKIGGDLFVVEIKDDSEISDPSPENIKKVQYAREHFRRVNEYLERTGDNERYHFNALTPRDYSIYFQKLMDGELIGFRSSLDVAIREEQET